MQTMAGELHSNHDLTALEYRMNTQPGGLPVHLRSWQALIAELIDNGVFYALRGELGVAQFVVCASGHHAERGVQRQVCAPVDGVGSLVKGVGIGCGLLVENQNDTVCHPRIHGGPIGGFQGAVEMDAGDCLAGGSCTGLDQFLFKQGFEAFGAGDEKIERRLSCHGAYDNGLLRRVLYHACARFNLTWLLSTLEPAGFAASMQARACWSSARPGSLPRPCLMGLGRLGICCTWKRSERS